MPYLPDNTDDKSDGIDDDDRCFVVCWTDNTDEAIFSGANSSSKSKPDFNLA